MVIGSPWYDGQSMPGSARTRNGSAARRVRAALNAPSGMEASLLDVAGEELLVLRIPLKRISLHDSLSDAEREVAALAVAGLSNTEIGRRRGTSGRTVANQMATIFRKLGVGSRAELARSLVVMSNR